MRQIRTLLLLLAVYAGLAASLRAQFTFSYRSAVNPTPATVSANGTVSFPGAALGAPTTVTFIVRNEAHDPWTVTSAAVSGADFKLTTPPDAVVPGLGAVQLTITFTPSSAQQQSTGSLTLQMAGAGAVASYSFFLVGAGQNANLVASYILNPDGNQIPIGGGGTITFPQTAIRATTTATFVVVNRGNGPGAVNNATVTGDQFRITGLPLLPFSIDPGKDFRFTVAFTPVSRDISRGSLQVALGTGALTVSLVGQGAGAAFAYEFVTSSGSTPVAPGGAIKLPDTAIGAVSAGVVRVRNTGNADGRVGTVAVVGSAFRLADLPPLPANVPQGGALTFTVQFAPRESGPASAQLLIDDVSLALNATAVGARLTLAARTGTTVTPLADGGTVTFPNTAAGSTSPVFIQVANTGNAAGTVNGISLSSPAFAIPALPALPATIKPGETLEFRIDFTPTGTGAVTAALQIDDHALTLRGVGNAPPPLPSISFTALPDTTNALQQPAVGLTLAEPYALDLTGKLTLNFVPDSFADDPSIQFSTGGRTVDFRIPANTTEAIFGESAKQVQFQAGTVSGVVSVTASFASGAANITPAPAPAKAVTVAAAPPQIRNVQVGTRTANSFELLVTGLSTTRSVSQFTINFTPAPGASLQTNSLTVNVEAPFTSWYQSTAGRAFGSQFTASVVINVTGDANSVQAVSVTAANARGSSSPAGASLR